LSKTIETIVIRQQKYSPIFIRRLLTVEYRSLKRSKEAHRMEKIIQQELFETEEGILCGSGIVD